MATYFITALNGSVDALDTAVKTHYSGDDSIQIETGKWLVSSPKVTSKEISDALLLGEATHLVMPIRGYYGRARSAVWEWLSAKATNG